MKNFKSFITLLLLSAFVSAWAGEVTVTGETTEWTDGNTYNVTGDVTIDTRISVSGTVTLNLGAGATLTAGKGIYVSEGNTLTIEGSGALMAGESCDNDHAGIGGNYGDKTGGNIVINGGVITATGGKYGAGIGAVKFGSGANITINGGKVTAEGGENGPGIGAWESSVTITGGEVTATGGDYGAGIGGGDYGAGGNITITGGVITATGGFCGAGIGGGSNRAGGNITINGGEVTATGSSGAGIGGGNYGAAGTIVINGGQVTAIGAGIGRGNSGATGGSLTLGWTDLHNDFIEAKRWSNREGPIDGFSSISFADGKLFLLSGTTTQATSENINPVGADIKLIPTKEIVDISNATIDGVSTHYTYTGDNIDITPIVTLLGETLTATTDYTIGFTKDGTAVENVNGVGIYSLTVAGTGFYSGSKSFLFYVNAPVDYQAYESGSLTDKTLAATAYDRVSSMTTTMSAGWYVVSDNVTVSDRISVSGDVHLVLCDGATLTAQTGIGVTDGNSLTIYSQSGNTGKLVATVPYNKVVNSYHAAIGGDRYDTQTDVGSPVKAGSVTIHGGDITATASFFAAGIGKAYEGKAGNITIYGGKVTASCDGESGIGIGGDEAVIQLGYARTDDYIQSLGYIGSVTVASDRKFATDDATPVDISGSVINLSSINGKKLTPKTYTVSFSLGYDGGTAPDAQIVYHGLTKAIEPTAPTRTIYSFGGWKNGSTAYDFTAAVTSDLSLKAIWTPDPAHFSVNDAGTEYTIHTAEGWGVFCDILAENDKGYFDGKTVKLDADIGTAENPVTRMAGGLDHEFTGIFDGRGHTLTVNLTGTSDYTAPFVYVKSQDDEHLVIIRNLKVAGTITTAYKYAAGIAANCRGIVHIENSQSSVTINCSKSGDGTHGGLVGYNGSSLTITGSAFTGKLITTNGTTHCGGFVGWINTTTNIINSLYAPAALADGETEVGATESSTFGRKKKAAVTITNSYYTRSFGTEQGLASRTITADEGVTIDAVAPVGDATETYTVSSITAYANGITCGGKFYYGNGDQVSLTLSHEDPAGYSISGYTASAGTLSSNDKSYLLAMPENGDVTISRSLAKLLTNSDISISAIDDQTYIGSEICPEITVTDGKASLELNTDYTVECSDNVNAGTATMAITGAGNYAGSVAKMFEIAQAPVTVSGVNAANKVYDGTTSATIAGTAIVSGVLGNDDVGVEYGTAVFADANVGEGIAVAFSGFTLTGADKGNYYLSNQPASVTANITKAPLTITAKDKAIVYGDEPANDGVEYSGFIGEENESVLGGKLTYSYNYKKLDKVGKYTITPSGLTASNYEITYAAGTLTVKKADISVEAPVAKEKLVYSGKAQELVTAGKTNFGTLLYSLDGKKYSSEIPTATDAKTYTVYYKVEGSDNWNAFDAKTIEVVIAKVPLTVTAKDKSIVYGNEPANDGVEYSGFIGEENESVLGGELTYSYNYQKLDKAGEYTITPSGLTAGNYEITYAAGTLTVEKADVSVEAPVAKEKLVYSGKAQELVTAGKTNFGTLLYSLDGEKYSAEIPTATDAKTYTVYYKVAESDNWNAFEAKKVEVKIAKADVSVEAPVAKEKLVYNGKAQELITAGKTSFGTLLYSLDGKKYSSEIPAATDAKTYTVYYKVEGSDNWNAFEAKKVEVKIAKADVSVEAPVAKEKLVYSGKSQELVTAGKTNFGTLLYSLDGKKYSSEIPAATDAKTYTVYYKVEGSDNWNAFEAKKVEVKIAKADVSVEAPVAKEKLVYSGKSQELVTAGKTNFGTLLYSLDGKKYSSEIPAATDAKTYTVYYKVEGSDNWNAYEAKKVEVVIAKSTAIGRMNTRAGRVIKVGTDRTFDLKGRPVRGSSNARGAYYKK